MAADPWKMAEAKARFGEFAARAESEGSQTITRSDRKNPTVVSANEGQRKTHRTGNLAEFLAASPLRGSRINITRTRNGLRDIKL